VTSRQAPDDLHAPAPRPLLTAACRPVAVAVIAACVAVTALLGARFSNQAHAGRLDRAVDARVQADLGGHRPLLHVLVQFGNAPTVTLMICALVLACVAARRWRAVVLVAVAVAAAGGLTEYLLKPLFGRTLAGALSYPSGHTTGVVALAAALAVLLADPTRPRLPAILRLLLAAAALLAASAVAVAVVGLGLHYFTDTVGGAATGAAVVLATALIIDRVADGARGGHRDGDPPDGGSRGQRGRPSQPMAHL